MLAYSGGFAGLVSSSEFSDLLLENIGTIKSSAIGNGNIFSSSGGFVGYGSSKFSNINVKNIGTINSLLRNAFRDTLPEIDPFQVASGGFVGRTTSNSEFSNIFLENIGTISSGMGEGNAVYPFNIYSGGFVGQVDGYSTFSNIVLNNIRDIGSSSYISGSFEFNSYSGGFAGAISDKAILSNIVLNNIGTISSSIDSDNPHPFLNSYSGGFVGDVESYSTFSNIVLNNIGIISSNVVGNSQIISSSGGFVGNISNSNFENIYLYFDLNSTILADANNASGSSIRENKGKFYGNFSGNTTFDNINLYYKKGTLNGVDSDSSDYAPNGQIFLHTYLDSSQGIKDFSSALETANSSVFKDNPILWNQDSNGNYNYYFANLATSTPTPPNINDSTTNTLPTLDMDNLFNKGGYFDSSSWLTKDSFNQSILDFILGKDNQGNSNLIFDLLTQDLESIRQSLDFLVSFLDGENDIKELFGDYYKVNDNIYGALNQDLTINLKFSNFIEALKQNKNINLAFLKDYRDKLNTYNQNKELYQSGGLPSLEQESLKKLLEEQYNELLNLEQTAKTNLESLQGLIKDSFKIDTNYTIFAKESLSPLNFTINIGSLNNFEDTQGNGDNSKEAILILPAQEKQEAIVEDGKERGRLCIVSDNAKTNNPCMAITY